MTTKTKISIALGALTTCAFSGAFAKERKLKESEVPKPVIEAVKKKYPSAQLAQFELDDEDGRTTYEVGIKDGGKKLDVSLLASGKIVEEESDIAIGDVPAAVKKGLAGSKYAKWTIKKAEKTIVDEKADAPLYELDLVLAKDRAEAVFDAAGKLVKDEREKDEDGDDD